MKKWLIYLLLPLLAGCTRIDETVAGSPTVVTEISVWYDSGAVRLQRDYTDDEKMQAMLTYLRCLEPYGTAADDPDESAGSYAKLTLRFSNGTEKIYEQRADRYFRLWDGTWQNIREERGQELPLLLGLMESDEK